MSFAPVRIVYMGSRHSKQTDQRHLLKLPLDVWNHRLCHYLTATCYQRLRACGDSQLNLRLDHLTPETLVFDYWHQPRLSSTFLGRLLQRTTIHAETHVSPDWCMTNYATRASSLEIVFSSQIDAFAFEQCPNLRVLHLINISSREPHNAYAIYDLVDALPATLVELATAHRPFHGGDPTRALRSAHPVPFSLKLEQKFPSLETLDIPTLSLSLPGAEQACTWPNSLTKMVLAIHVEYDGQPVVLTLPPRLTSLTLTSSSTHMRSGVLKSSSLPTAMVHFRAEAFRFDCDVPLPRQLATLMCQRLLPDIIMPFPIPPTITCLSPSPSTMYMERYPPVMRILAHLRRPDACVGPLTTEDVDEWEMYERSKVDLYHVSRAFARPTFFDFGDRKPSVLDDCIIPSRKVFATFAKRIGASVTQLANINLEWQIAPLMAHCKWLEEVTICTPWATSAFIHYVVELAHPSKPEPCRLPHLLRAVDFNLDDNDLVEFMRNALCTRSLFALPNVRRLRLTMDIARLEDEEFCLAIACMFPKTESLSLEQVTYDRQNSTRLKPSHLNVLLTNMPALRRLDVHAWYSTLKVSGTASVFVDELASHVESIKLEVNNYGCASRN